MSEDETSIEVVVESDESLDVAEGHGLEDAEIQVFIAASLGNAMEEIKELYNQEQPNITVTYNADSSGTLLTQVQEGYECDIFFSAAPKPLNELEESGFLEEGTKVS